MDCCGYVLDAARNYRTGWPKPGDGSPCPGLQYLPPDDNDDDDGARTGTKCHAGGDVKGGHRAIIFAHNDRQRNSLRTESSTSHRSGTKEGRFARLWRLYVNINMKAYDDLSRSGPLPRAGICICSAQIHTSNLGQPLYSIALPSGPESAGSRQKSHTTAASSSSYSTAQLLSTEQMRKTRLVSAYFSFAAAQLAALIVRKKDGGTSCVHWNHKRTSAHSEARAAGWMDD